jgi:hypothetical protein
MRALQPPGWAAPIYREIIGRHYPAMAAVEVGSMVEEAARVGIGATGVIPFAAG